ncbi:J domain-containing protein [Desulfurivibrio alkaliphilus]|uniref:Heat shock protein DnaJ domain protein n=1 Tax=Desulfurivibrio alkaliphilus (strain DSM 19089 / UNIQEM U267 / AHT2) TaxID=589865 RepID=D6Z6D6_DESAT|nr:J domain-containing protein [Desulfurivibrio alkaliphilus]ADH86901.1 heat shock protein DnaJ domain protein [Desulfurivibrio alkaliphilus AHT 2]
MKYDELKTAMEVLGLDDQATLAEIKRRHRELVKRHHPDGKRQQPSAEDQRLIRRINTAYRVITNYVNNYRFSFSREEFYRQNPEARLYDQFDHDPIWGPGGR